ncbi:hypothetical protein [Arthrobacter sp. A2-55]|uniref:hypothetical protein n=1 Tax=Arthrobacter sp. A2-55 TaxID=2897337 RepID=UPI0021CD374B|nr:hypothetical protein [Arthrobacter sp. A2-55]MCU6481927.1 hypothetical protein [Arthrobacter sp. A2-55]
MIACDDCLRACEPIAQALTGAGIGSLHDAWEKGVYASTSGATNYANPYPKASET